MAENTKSAAANIVHPIDLVFLAAWLLVLAAVGQFGWQIYSYLQEGRWHSLSALDLMIFTGIGGNWASGPTSWIGVWKLLRGVPSTITILAVAGFVYWLAESNRPSSP